MKQKQISVDIYNLTVIIYLGTPAELAEQVKLDINPEFQFGNKNGMTCRNKNKDYEIFMNSEQRVHTRNSLFVHELFHIVDSFTKKIGAYEERELRAYLAGYIFSQAEDFLKEED